MIEVSSSQVAFIGCGNIAHIHIRFLKKAGYNVAAVCDASRVRVDLFAQKYGIVKRFSDANELFAVEKPVIVHILTPPHTHYQLILMALNAGCNVLVEKPLCQTMTEYEQIATLAAERGLMVSVDHTRVYNPMIRVARERVNSGVFGKIVRMEYAYDDPSLIKAASHGNDFRWARGVPPWFAQVRGGVLTDLLPHPLSVCLSFDEGLHVRHIQSRVLGGSILEELSVMMQSDHVDANVFLSVNQRPLKNIFSIYCEKGSIQIDLRNMHTIYQPERRLPGILSRVVVTMSGAYQISRNFLVNIAKIVIGKAHPYDGLDELIRKFYEMVAAGKSGDVPLINSSKVTGLIEEIVNSALGTQAKTIDQHISRPAQTVVTPVQAAEYLVTGGTGFIGKKVLDVLIDGGKSIRALCRQTSNINRIPKGVNIAYGDLKDSSSCNKALAGVKTVIHCAAAMSGDWAEFYESTVQGTRNLIEAIEKSQVKRFIYISSLGVLDYNKLSNGDNVDESAPIEARPADRGFYTRAKVEAEQLIREFASRNHEITTIILRPGLVYGQESNNNLQNCGILLDKYLLVFGLGKRSLGLNYVENLAQAVALAGVAELTSGSIINIVDSEQPPVRTIIKEHNKLSEQKVFPIYIPVTVWKGLFLTVDLLLLLKNKILGTFRYRFASNAKILNYKSDLAHKALEWQPRYNFEEAFSRTYQKNICDAASVEKNK